MKTLATIAIIAAATAALAWAVNFGLDRQEVIDCNIWAQQADAYPAFYLTHWQFEQCSAHGIKIDAPVK